MGDAAFVLPFDDEDADIAAVGGKGASLARMARAGFPVPGGFHVTTGAYREFMAGGAGEEIEAALTGVDLEDPEQVERAAEVIAGALGRRDVPEAVAAEVLRAYEGMSGGLVAVRSSATAEDLPGMSAAGQHESFLGVTGADALLAAVKRCWTSLWTARAIGYRARHGAGAGVALAVVMQRLVPAESSGVLFTANPLTGARDEMVVNAVWGLGEAVVGGAVTPDTYVVADGDEVRREVADKAMMTVLGPEGTRLAPVPEHLRRAPVLDRDGVVELARLGARVQRFHGEPMDVEWARRDGRFALLQARPVTGAPAAEEWNDSLRGDHLWTCANLREAVPAVMTPVTWSLVREMAMPDIGGHPVSGNIGGRFYLNIGLLLGIAGAFGLGRVARRGMEPTFGRLPDGVEVPPPPMGRLGLLRALVPVLAGQVRQAAAYRRRLPRLLAETPARCDALRARIREAEDPAAMLALWESDVDDLVHATARVLELGARTGRPDRSAARLRALVGEAEAATLMTGLHGGTAELASLGPVLGLARLRRGEIDTDAYARAWGHRCPEEFELSAPRPAEDPAWLDRLAADCVDPEELLRRQAAARERAWERLRRDHPRAVGRLRRGVERASGAARSRERARSEFVRAFWVLRAFVLRACELTGRGDDLFFLTIAEVLAVLGGDAAPLASVPARRAAYARYRALPPYPTVIRGRFDPAAWAADPDRRADVHDERAAPRPAHGVITGSPGVAGVVDGVARVVATVEEGQALESGEVLVTAVTNVGWTPLFPRAAAVVTDVGAPLSHAAIVARELGIPAVVGCGDATARLSTGDLIRVDGSRGTVTVVRPVADPG